MRKIEDPEKVIICEFDGVSAGTVYLGGISFLERWNDKLDWRVDDGCSWFKPCKELTLKEIAEQMNSPMITVFVESPLHGEIYQYGNYGDEWWQIGETGGYA